MNNSALSVIFLLSFAINPVIADNIIRTSAPVTLIKSEWVLTNPMISVVSTDTSCTEWLPDARSIELGKDFTQKRDCIEKTSLITQQREKDVYSNAERNVGDPVESETTRNLSEARAASGTATTLILDYVAGVNQNFAGVYRRLDGGLQAGTRIVDNSNYSILFYYYKNGSSCEIRYAHVNGLGFKPGATATAYSKEFMLTHLHATLYRTDGSLYKTYSFPAPRATDGAWFSSMAVSCADASPIFSNPAIVNRLHLSNN